MHAAPDLPLIPTGADAARPTWVAYSGGLDSTVLLHRLASDPLLRERGLRAVHAHHGLHAEADAWAAHCTEVCAALGVPLEVCRVVVRDDAGQGPEAAARAARREAFAGLLGEGDVLALAQHRDDQAETFLLRALRASGPDGLAAIRPWRRFAGGWMWRPLLDTPRARLRAWAEARGLHWIEDPSNADLALDRNFLRHRVLPLLRERWPHADIAFARSSAVCADSADLLAAHDPGLLATVREEVGHGLSVRRLRALAPAKRARVLRHWVATLGWPPLPADAIARIEADLLEAPVAPDRSPVHAWHGVEIRRWQDALHAVDPRHALPDGWSCDWDGHAPLTLPNGDRLALTGIDGFPSRLRVQARVGGERIRLPDRGHHHTLKHVLQEYGIAPWERARLPLLATRGGDLLAVGDTIRSDAFDQWLGAVGADLVWTRI